MSEPPETATTAEDRLLESLVERLNDALLPSFGEADAASRSLLREYTELVGLLAYELQPATPLPATRRALLAAVKEGSDIGGPGRGTVAALRPRPPAWQRRALPWAAGLAVALLGLSAWQWARLGDQTTTIQRLSDQLSQAQRQESEVVRFQRELQQATQKLSLVTSRGVEVCSLYPPRAVAGDAVPRGTLFVAADHQHWYLRIEGLEPCAEGRAYQLWFLNAEGLATSAGLLEVGPGRGLEVTSESMPAGTIAVSITLEPAGGSEQPSGPSVLYGDEVLRIL